LTEWNSTYLPAQIWLILLTALEFVVAELPHNLQELRLSAYIPAGTKFVHDKQVTVKKEIKPKLYNPLEVQYDNTTNNKFFTSNSYYYTTRNGDVFEDEEEFEDRGDFILGAYTPK
jgi:hypothetical protein